MSHNLEQRADGTYSYVGARVEAWHGLGVTYTDQDAITVDQALTDLDAGNIIKTPLTTTVLTADGVSTLDIARHMATVRLRSTGPQMLGIVGPDYPVWDEAHAFRFLDNVVDSGVANISAAGLLDDGRKAFCCLRLPEKGIKVGGVDPVDLYLFAAMGHDACMSFTIGVTPIRVVCQNTVDAALRGTTRVYRRSHRPSAELNVDDARRAIELSYDYADAFAAEAEELITTTCTNDQFDAIVKHLYGPRGTDPAKSAVTRFTTKRDALMELFAAAPTQEAGRGTAWAAYNALVEQVDWARQVRGADSDAEAMASRAEGNVLGALGVGPVADAKAGLLTAVKAYV